MGLFDFLKKKHLKPPNPSERVDLPAPMRPDISIDDFAVMKRAERDSELHAVWELTRTEVLPLRFARPDFDLSLFCFDNKEYVCQEVVTINSASGEVVRDDVSFFADANALREFLLDLDDLESMIDGNYLGIPNLPPLRTMLDSFVPVESIGETPENTAKLILKPLTKTGKIPKYPIEVSFYCHRYMNPEDHCPKSIGSNGTVSYLKDGRIGKARVTYHKPDAHYTANWKSNSEDFYLDSMDYMKAGEFDSVRIYQFGK